MIGLFYVLSSVELCLIFHILLFSKSVESTVITAEKGKAKLYKNLDKPPHIERTFENGEVIESKSNIDNAQLKLNLFGKVGKYFSDFAAILLSITSVVGAFGQILEYSTIQDERKNLVNVINAILVPCIISVFWGFSSLLADKQAFILKVTSLGCLQVIAIIFGLVNFFTSPRGDRKNNLLLVFPAMLLISLMGIIPAVHLGIQRIVEDSTGHMLLTVRSVFAAILSALFFIVIRANATMPQHNITNSTFFCLYLTLVNAASLVLNYYVTYFIYATRNSPNITWNIIIAALSFFAVVFKLNPVVLEKTAPPPQDTDKVKTLTKVDGENASLPPDVSLTIENETKQ